MNNEKCELGCKVYHGGEINHHPDCVFYTESRTEMYDKAVVRIKKLEEAMQKYVKDCADLCYGFSEEDKEFHRLQFKELLNYTGGL